MYEYTCFTLLFYISDFMSLRFRTLYMLHPVHESTGIDKDINESTGIDKDINESTGIDKDINESTGIDKDINV